MTIVKPIQIEVANQVFEAWNQLGCLLYTSDAADE